MKAGRLDPGEGGGGEEGVGDMTQQAITPVSRLQLGRGVTPREWRAWAGGERGSDEK